MKTLPFYLLLLFAFFVQGELSAQVSQVTYSPDSLSGELRVTKADYMATAEYVWTLQLPANSTVRVTRINNVYLLSPPSDVLRVNNSTTILTQRATGEYTTTLSANTLTFTLNAGRSVILNEDKDPVIIIKFAKLLNSGGSETVVQSGDLELTPGVLRAYGSENYMGSKVAAILGGDYSSYTCFGAVNGGRIRGSNEGYLILEGNPNGYGNPTIYMNRYVSNGNIVMTSSGGKVGMGIDVPQEKLHLGGALRGDGTGGALRIKTQYGQLEVGAQNDSAVHFVTSKPKFSFNQNMDVKGILRATEVKIETIDHFPDFVFDKNYHLLPLPKVKAFIDENGHLPEIPSAQEVKENGMGIAEMQAKLLQKIEELTLYAIEQNRTIEELKREVKALKETR